MIGRKVESRWHRVCGVIVDWQPLGAGMNDLFIREDSGREVWLSSDDPTVKPVDGLGPLPRRDVARAWADFVALRQLRAIRARHVAEWDRPWYGCEHGKAFVGFAIDGAIFQLSKG